MGSRAKRIRKLQSSAEVKRQREGPTNLDYSWASGPNLPQGFPGTGGGFPPFRPGPFYWPLHEDQNLKNSLLGMPSFWICDLHLKYLDCGDGFTSVYRCQNLTDCMPYIRAVYSYVNYISVKLGVFLVFVVLSTQNWYQINSPFNSLATPRILKYTHISKDHLEEYRHLNYRLQRGPCYCPMTSAHHGEDTWLSLGFPWEGMTILVLRDKSGSPTISKPPPSTLNHLGIWSLVYPLPLSLPHGKKMP